MGTTATNSKGNSAVTAEPQPPFLGASVVESAGVAVVVSAGAAVVVSTGAAVVVSTGAGVVVSTGAGVVVSTGAAVVVSAGVVSAGISFTNFSKWGTKLAHQPSSAMMTALLNSSSMQR